MAAAGRESSEALTRIAEEQAMQRTRNAEEADAFRAARASGLVLTRVPLEAVRATVLRRDRMDLAAVAAAPEMEELKASLRQRGQREAIEVFAAGVGIYELKSGWRRVEALRQLYAETGDARFAQVVARVVPSDADRDGLYVDMVEENAIREDVSFAEMAQVAIAMAADPDTAAATAEEAVNRLYASLQKVKRSNIRRFVDLLESVGDLLPAPREIPKNLGADAARAVQGRPQRLAALRARLALARDAAAQNAALAAAVADAQATAPTASETVAAGGGDGVRRDGRSGEKYEFRHEEMKITARPGEVRIRCDDDFAEMPRDRLEAAIAAFRAALRG
jgi:ParB family chromosome partitioning protein